MRGAERVDLGSIAQIVMGTSPRGSSYNYEAVGDPLLNGPTEFGPRHPRPVLYTTEAKRFAEPGDLLFCVRGSTTGRMNWADRRYAIGRGVAAIRGSSAMETVFLRAAIELALPGVLAGATGSTMPNLNVDAMHRIPVPLNPTRARAGSILSAIEDLIDNNRRRVEVLEEMARAIYREWFVRFRYPGHEDVPLVDSSFGPIPEGWAVAVSGDLQKRGLLEIGDGYRAKNAEMSTGGPGLPFIRVANVRDGHLNIDGSDELPMDYVERLRSKISLAGDVVISMKGTVGRRAFVQDWHPKMAYSPQVSFWRSLNSGVMSPAYLYQWIRSEDFARQCAAVKGATDMADYVNLTDQRLMKVVVPRADVMEAFTAIGSPVLRLIGRLQAQSGSLATLRDELLPSLVIGRIDVSLRDLDPLTEAAIP